MIKGKREGSGLLGQWELREGKVQGILKWRKPQRKRTLTCASKKGQNLEGGRGTSLVCLQNTHSDNLLKSPAVYEI